METRIYKKTGKPISLLGFGCMRLPRLNDEKPDIDISTAESMIDRAYAQGVNYFDTAYMYHEGMSETFLGHALKKYPRESFYLADKMPGCMGIVHSLEDGKRIFAEQLQRCGVDYFDFTCCTTLPALRTLKKPISKPASSTICWKKKPPDGSAISDFPSTAIWKPLNT